MTFPKHKKRFAVLLIAVVVVVVLGAGALLGLTLGQPSSEQEDQMQLVLLPQTQAGSYAYRVADGPDYSEVSYPLAFYGFAPPEGYEHTANAEESANRFSLGYRDVYSNGETTITFAQSVAYSGYGFHLSSDTAPLEIQFGDETVIYNCNASGTEVYWLHQDSLLCLSVSQTSGENEMLQLISQVEYQTEREPVYSSLELSRGGADVESVRYFSSKGNPQIPDSLFPLEFAQPPEGFYATGQNPSSQEISPFSPEIVFTYQNDAGDTITLTNSIGATVLFSFDSSQLRNSSITDKVLDVQVGDSPGFFYQNRKGAQLVWVDDYFTLELEYSGSITQQELIALAQTLSAAS